MTNRPASNAILVILIFLLASCDSSRQYDARAIESLDQMSEVIGKLNSVSYTLDTINSIETGTEIRNEHDVYMRGPDKMHVHTIGTNGEKSYWYNGSRLAYFSHTKDVYAMVDAPDNIIKAIDYISEKYGVDFPAADFFYPNFTDDILDNSNSIYFSEETVDGVDCVSVLATSDDETIEIWIDKATHLPYRMVVESQLDKDQYYDVVFSNWRIDPNLPDVIFDFEPPGDAEETQLQTTS